MAGSQESSSWSNACHLIINSKQGPESVHMKYMDKHVRIKLGDIHHGKKVKDEDVQAMFTFSITDVKRTKIRNKMQPVFRLTCHENEKFSKKDVHMEIIDKGIEQYQSK